MPLRRPTRRSSPSRRTSTRRRPRGASSSTCSAQSRRWEREAIGERTAIALTHKRKLRQVYGPTPFGFRRDGDQLVEIPHLIAARAEAAAMLAAGASLRQIGAHLRTTVGGVWHPQVVKGSGAILPNGLTSRLGRLRNSARNGNGAK